jgi:hypothetical protein
VDLAGCATAIRAPVTRVSKPPASLIACISNDLEQEYTNKHLESIDKLKFRVEKVRSKTDLLSRLTTVDAGVVYLYCHGGHMKVSGTEAAVPFLAVGTSEKLTPGDVGRLWKLPGCYLYWTVANPLVFINGCHTVEVTPDVLVNFVDAFAGLNSSGVIGTEVTVHQALANEVGTLFLQSFLTKPVGEAIRDVRHRLVRKGNLMGLAYTAYCLSSLRLADALASRQNESVQQRQ